MNKNIIKSILIILVLVAMFAMLTPKYVYAGDPPVVLDEEVKEPSFSLKKIIKSLEEFLEQGKTGEQADLELEIAGEIQPIINTLYWIGVAVVMGASMFLGVQYFQASGDPKAKAALQSKLIGFLISSVVLLAAYPIWNYLIRVLSSVMG